MVHRWNADVDADVDDVVDACWDVTSSATTNPEPKFHPNKERIPTSSERNSVADRGGRERRSR